MHEGPNLPIRSPLPIPPESNGHYQPPCEQKGRQAFPPSWRDPVTFLSGPLLCFAQATRDLLLPWHLVSPLPLRSAARSVSVSTLRFPTFQPSLFANVGRASERTDERANRFLPSFGDPNEHWQPLLASSTLKFDSRAGSTPPSHRGSSRWFAVDQVRILPSLDRGA